MTYFIKLSLNIAQLVWLILVKDVSFSTCNVVTVNLHTTFHN